MRRIRHMIGEERRSMIMDVLRREDIVRSSVLQKRFKVSDMTIRRDLEKLERLGLLKRVHGGAVVNQSTSGKAPPEGAFEDRMPLYTEEKAAIGKSAASLVQDGQFIFLDGSTTAIHMTKYLTGFNHVTVVTDGIEVLRALAGKPGIEVIILGGTLQRDHNTIDGPFAIDNAEQINLDYLFLTCGGFDRAGVYDYGTIGTSIKRILIRRARKKVVLANSEKHGKRHYFLICTWGQIDMLITDEGLPVEGREALKRADVEVVVAGRA